MTLAETILLCRAIEAMFPAQRLDEQTPEAWAMVLDDIPYGVAMVALRQIAKERTFIAACDIRHTVKRMRTTTRRAIRREARDRGILVNVDLEADAAICAGLADFDGIDLMGSEPADSYYARETAHLESWTPARLELTS